MTNITNLTMKNMQISECQTTCTFLKFSFNMFTECAVLFKDCYNVWLNSITIIGESESFTQFLLSINTLGKSSFIDQRCNRLVILYNDIRVANKYHNLQIKNCGIAPDIYDITNLDNISDSIITVYMFKYFYSVQLEVLNTKFDNSLDLKLMPNKFGNSIQFNQCIFEKYQCDIFQLESQDITNVSHLHTKNHQVIFVNCEFYQNRWLLSKQRYCVLITTNGSINVIIKDCIFKQTILQVIEMNNDSPKTDYFKSVYHMQSELPTLLISNTTL